MVSDEQLILQTGDEHNAQGTPLSEAIPVDPEENSGSPQDIIVDAAGLGGEMEQLEQSSSLDSFQSPIPGVNSDIERRLEDTNTLLQGVSERIDGLQQMFHRDIADSSLHRSSLDKLHREMLDYKDNFLKKAMEPMFRQLIGLADHMDEVCSQDQIAQSDVSFLRDELIEALNRYGIEPFHSDDSVYDSGLHKIVRTLPTADEAQNRVIAQRTKSGYRLDGFVIRPEWVSLFKYDPAFGEMAPKEIEPQVAAESQQ